MALCHMLKRGGHNIVAVTIDHGLRPESRDEAELVGKWMKQCQIPHYILSWDDENKPETGIMEAAREARYTLLTDFCKENGAKTLAVAHHMDDQIETFLYRLTKGSGLDGLTGMENETSVNDITLLRPLLNLTRQEITAYCQDNDIPFIDDPSNINGKYTRVRFRRFLENEGLDTKRISKTIERLSRASNALDTITTSTFNSVVSGDIDALSINLEEWAKLHNELRIRILQKIIRTITANFFGAQLAKIEDSLSQLEELQIGKSFALGGVLFTKSQDAIKAVKEVR